MGYWHPSMHHRLHDRGIGIQKGLHRGGRGWHQGSLHRGGWTDPLYRQTCDTTGYGQQAGGTHPTGMLSSYRPQRSWAKVIFLHLSVILLTGGWVSQHALQVRSVPGGVGIPACLAGQSGGCG